MKEGCLRRSHVLLGHLLPEVGSTYLQAMHVGCYSERTGFTQVLEWFGANWTCSVPREVSGTTFFFPLQRSCVCPLQ